MRPNENWDESRRRQGQRIIYLRRAKFDLEADDKHALILDWMMASKLIRRAQVWFKCGGILTPDRLETILRTMFPVLRDVEKRTGQAPPSTLRTSRRRFPQRESPPLAEKMLEAASLLWFRSGPHGSFYNLSACELCDTVIKLPAALSSVSCDRHVGCKCWLQRLHRGSIRGTMSSQQNVSNMTAEVAFHFFRIQIVKMIDTFVQI